MRLGGYVTRDSTDSKDVRTRINSAARAAFGALISKCIFQSTHVNCDACKRAVHERLILSICLYGCESLCLKDTLYTELRQFHARCVRTMSRTNLQFTPHLDPSHLNWQTGERVGFRFDEHLDIARRQLRWLGHVSRMPFDRLPRRMLSSWLPCAQDAEVPKRWPMGHGRTIKTMGFLTLPPQIGPSLLLIAKSGMQWSNNDYFDAVLEDNVSHTPAHGIQIHPHAPPLFCAQSLSFLILVSRGTYAPW